MQLADFTFELPDELIAKYPADQRTASRLLHLDSQIINQLIFKDIINLFNPGDLLILNNTKVVPARFYGHKATGAKLEFLLERVMEENHALVYIKANRAPKPGSEILLHCLDLGECLTVTVLEKKDNLYLIKLNGNNITWHELLDKIGEIPLPPYINRQLDNSDQSRYQTVYAKHNGAVAAPTAGLHFDDELLAELVNKGVIVKYVTLHVGSGTFAPVRVDNIREHKMHSESYNIGQDVIEAIINLKNNNKINKLKNKITAVGTTSLRCLESLTRNLDSSELEQDYTKLLSVPMLGDTDIFIYPGFKFKLVDNLITNFHLPGSTLMMLVSAFVGMEEIKRCYKFAIDNKYRFYSYGDAMFLTRTAC